MRSPNLSHWAYRVFRSARDPSERLLRLAGFDDARGTWVAQYQMHT